MENLAMSHRIFTSIQSGEIAGKLRGATVVIDGRKMLSAAWFSMEELCSGEWSFGGEKAHHRPVAVWRGAQERSA
jgi:hypothetical protein